MHRIVFNTRAEARFAKHLKVVFNPHADALGLDEPVVLFKVVNARFQFITNGLTSGFHPSGCGHVLISWVEVEFIQLFAGLHAYGIELADGFEGVAPKFKANRGLHVGRPNINRLAAGPEIAALQDGIVARVLIGHHLRQ